MATTTVDTIPQKVNFIVRQGSAIRLTLELVDQADAPIDLTGYTMRMQVRKSVYSPTITLELTTENGGIVILDQQDVATIGKVDLIVLSTVSAAIASANYSMDLEMIPPSGEANAVGVVAGIFNVQPEVTK